MLRQRVTGFAGLVQLRPALDDRLQRLFDRHVRRVVDGAVACPAGCRPSSRALRSTLLDVRVVIGRIGLVAGAEVEDVAGAAALGQARAEHFAALEPGDEHRLERLRHGELLAIHLLVLELEILAEALRRSDGAG